MNITSVVKSTFNGTLPNWFTLPSNAINPTISICGGGGGGGGACDRVYDNSGGGGGGGETLWEFGLNPGDTIYYVLGAGGAGGAGSSTTSASNGQNGGITIVEGSANFPVGGLQAWGGNGGKGSKSNQKALGGGWIGSGLPYSIGGQAGGNGGYYPTDTSGQNGYPCYSVPGGTRGANAFTMFNQRMFGGGGGGATMLGYGGGGGGVYITGGGSVWNFTSATPGVLGGGGGGGGVGVDTNSTTGGSGANGGQGWVQIKYSLP